jgi:hypothetical protein
MAMPTKLAPGKDFPEVNQQKTGSPEHVSNFEARKQKVISKVREYTRITFDELHVASRQETDNLIEGTKYITSKDIEGWEEYVNGTMQDQITSARSLYNELMDPLLGALHEKAISERVISEIYAKFRSEDVGYKQKEAYVQSVLPNRLKEWKRVKEERDGLMKDEGIDLIKKSDIKNKDALFRPESFADLKWEERKKLVEEAAAYLSAHKNGTEHLMESAREELEFYVKQKILHPSKVATWMKRIFVKNANPKDIEAFMQKTVRPHAERWRATKVDFDNLNQLMKGKVPRGFTPLTENAFLQMNYKQRTSYCALTTIRLNNVEEENKQLASLKLRIRHELDTKDYEGAKEDLAKAFEIRKDDRELVSMKQYIEDHFEEREVTQEEKETVTENPEPVLAQLREMLKQVPDGTMKTCYTRALNSDMDVALRFFQVSGNAAWVVENGYASEAENVKNAHSEYNKQKTREYVENGHTNQIERNIVDGDTAKEEAIRDECTKAQMLYVGDMGTDAVMRKIEANADNEGFGYWTTFVPKDATFDLHNRVIKQLHWPMKQALRKLDKMGYRFTLAGSPERKAGAKPAVAPKAKPSPAKSYGHSYSTAA